MYELFSTGELKPAGWLKKQLEIQASGLSGNLDLIWPDVRDSAWIGGDKEGWERVPYWLDGFLPLAYLLDRKDLIDRAEKYLDSILDRQQEDGWICPCAIEERAGYDLWAYLLICKVLALHVSITGSERSEKGLYNAMRCLYGQLKEGKVRLTDWGLYRWFEGLIPLLTLKEKYGEEWIVELGAILREQGVHYPDFEKYWKTPKTEWTKRTHIVNLAMAFKAEALCSAFFGESADGGAERMWKILSAYNGTAAGIFTGDECLSGIGNVHGTELCAVAELMYACEWNYALTKDPVWAERLEKAAFNALPATISDDMWTHQYVQMANQIACKRFPGASVFRTNSSEAHLFGLEPNYGCCTANFNQAWPKLAQNVFLKEGRTIHAALLLPAQLDTAVGGVGVSIRCDTLYPFRHKATFTVSAAGNADFDFSLRVPAFAKTLRINGQSGPVCREIVFRGPFSGETTITVEFTDEARLVPRPHDLYSVEYGTLVFSLPLTAEYRKLEFTRGGVERKAPYCDYELTSKDEWRYGFADVEFTVEERPESDVPFSSEAPMLTLRTKLARVPWSYADGYDSVSAPVPSSDVALSCPEDKRLYPYGCAKLRVTEMPLTK